MYLDDFISECRCWFGHHGTWEQLLSNIQMYPSFLGSLRGSNTNSLAFLGWRQRALGSILEFPLLLLPSAQLPRIGIRLNLGFRRSSVVSNNVLQQRPKNRWAGLVSISSLGVLHQSRSAWNSPTPAARHFVKSCLTVLLGLKRHVDKWYPP